jgi:hypothetical protein
MEPKQPISFPAQPGPPPTPAFEAALVARRLVYAELRRNCTGEVAVSCGTIPKRQVGAVFRIRFLDEDGNPMDLRNSPIKKIIFGRPVVGWFERTAVFTTDGEDGLIEYKTISEDELDAEGDWRMQGYAELPTFVDRIHTEIATFYVEPIIEEMNIA